MPDSQIDTLDLFESAEVLEKSNMVKAPFGPIVTDWHYPMYPGALISNMRDAPYPYSQAYASLTRIGIDFSESIPSTLYCGIFEVDRSRLREDGIRVGTKLYRSPEEIEDYDILLKVKIPRKLEKKFWGEENFFVSVAQIRLPYFKVIREKAK